LSGGQIAQRDGQVDRAGDAQDVEGGIHSNGPVRTVGDMR
jgi:hypothetical protein